MTRATATKEKPIIMGAESVRAILEGRKTQTRRVVKLTDPTQTYACHDDDDGWPVSADEAGIWKRDPPLYEVGQRLWVKEAWYPSDQINEEWSSHKNWPSHLHTPSSVLYRATADDYDLKVTSFLTPLFMPRWASRLTLKVTAVRIERLQEISIEDVLAEGITADKSRQYWREEAGQQFISHWNKINGKKHPWKSNPWVWVIEFKRLETAHAR